MPSASSDLGFSPAGAGVKPLSLNISPPIDTPGYDHGADHPFTQKQGRRSARRVSVVGRHVNGQLHAVAGSRSSLRHNAECQATPTTLALGHLGATPQSIRANNAPTLKESGYTCGECRRGCVGIADPTTAANTPQPDLTLR